MELNLFFLPVLAIYMISHKYRLFLPKILYTVPSSRKKRITYILKNTATKTTAISVGKQVQCLSLSFIAKHTRNNLVKCWLRRIFVVKTPYAWLKLHRFKAVGVRRHKLGIKTHIQRHIQPRKYHDELQIYISVCVCLKCKLNRHAKCKNILCHCLNFLSLSI